MNPFYVLNEVTLVLERGVLEARVVHGLVRFKCRFQRFRNLFLLVNFIAQKLNLYCRG